MSKGASAAALLPLLQLSALRRLGVYFPTYRKAEKQAPSMSSVAARVHSEVGAIDVIAQLTALKQLALELGHFRYYRAAGLCDPEFQVLLPLTALTALEELRYEPMGHASGRPARDAV